MEPLLSVQVTPELRAAATAMHRRLSAWGSPRVVPADGWQAFADAVGAGMAGGSDAGERSTDEVLISVGPIAAAVDLVAEAAGVGAIGFIAPAAYRRRWWQREPTVFLDPTMHIWGAGWTPIAVERIDVAGADSTIEVVVGNARPTPERPVSPR